MTDSQHSEPATPPASQPPIQSSSYYTLGESVQSNGGSALYAQVRPQPLDGAFWIAQNDRLAEQLGLTDALSADDGLELFMGGENPRYSSAQAVSTVYSGHQFGVWAGQLGDGRAHLIGSVYPQNDASGALSSSEFELQLKGSGHTPFSRMGDGKAVLRSSIREYLASIAMQGLGVPTTQALCLIGSNEPVQRETMETAAVVTRVAPSFLRFGHLEHFTHHNQPDALRAVADYALQRFYTEHTEIDDDAERYAAMLRSVARRTAQLMAQWQAVGFCHGVMNSDNMSLLGLTIDYGPFQFMDAFVPGHICNHSDTQGRYAYHAQPNIGYWNMHALAHAMLELIDGNGKDKVEFEQAKRTRQAIGAYVPAYEQAYQRQMLLKLGVLQSKAEDGLLPEQIQSIWDLGQRLLRLMAQYRVDYTRCFVLLTEAVEACDAAVWCAAFEGKSCNKDEAIEIAQAWWQEYDALVLQQLDREQVVSTMRQHNPLYVLRNYMAQQAIEAAQKGDFSVVQRLQTVLHAPYQSHAGCENWEQEPPEWAADLVLSCSS